MKAFETYDDQEYSQFNGTCWIWGTPAVRSYSKCESTIEYNSPRAAGKYSLNLDSGELDVLGSKDERTKATLTTILLKEREQGQSSPLINKSMLEKARSATPLLHDEKIIKLLKYLKERTDSPGDEVELSFNQHVTDSKLYLSVEQAIIEAKNHKEVWYFLEHLSKTNHLSGFAERELNQIPYANVNVQGLSIPAKTKHSYCIKLLPKGNSFLDKNAIIPIKKECFIAMSFDKRWDGLYHSAIKPAICECGFKPIRIDESENNGKIDEAICDAIKNAQFVVADVSLTDGIRNANVYYECGLAHGGGIEVIFTCKKNDTNDELILPFDTRQYKFIFWQDLMELKEKLIRRISETIGKRSV